MISIVEQLFEKIRVIKGIAEAGHHIAQDELTKGQFEQIIRELNLVGFQEWQASRKDKDDT
jgi:hypothetical protein|tara:strand:- start:218 stop:400 length:183 start_codon:yes stop_codon:yes gene_type:complete